MNKFSTVLLALCAVFCAASCQLRPLEDPEESIVLKVVVHDENISNVTCDIYNDELTRPVISTDMIRAMFYDPMTGDLVTQAFISQKGTTTDGRPCIGGTIKISPGNYNLVCYNFDTANTLVSGDSGYESIYAYTNDVSSVLKTRFIASRADKAAEKAWEDLTIKYDPDHLVVSRDPNLRIGPHSGVLTIETDAYTCIDTYYLQVRVKGLQYANTASAVVTGMSPSNHFAIDSRDTENPSALYFELQKSQDSRITDANKDVLCTLFNTFGRVYEAESDLSITFSVITRDGKSLFYDIPMDNVFLTEDALKRHWLLIEDTITIPEPDDPETENGGFQPRVDDWDVEHGEIAI